MILDEPTAHLDRRDGGRALLDIFAATDCSILLITHRREGLGLVDEVVVLVDG